MAATKTTKTKKTTKKTASRSKKKTQLYTYGGVAVLGVVITAGAVFYGQADEGAIDVAATIESSNQVARERAEAEGREAPSAVPVNNSRRAAEPNGGLIGKGKSEQPPEPEPKEEVEGTSTSTATSTDAGTAGEDSETGTSTEPVPQREDQQDTDAEAETQESTQGEQDSPADTN